MFMLVGEGGKDEAILPLDLAFIPKKTTPVPIINIVNSGARDEDSD